MVDTLAALFLVGLLGWFWSDSLKARERALRACQWACEQTGAQLLDGSVVFARLGLGRDARGVVRVRRDYGFEYSMNGADRWRGRAVLLGQWVLELQLDLPEGLTILEPGYSREPPLH